MKKEDYRIRWKSMYSSKLLGIPCTAPKWECLQLFQKILLMIYKTYLSRKKNLLFPFLPAVTAEKPTSTFYHCMLLQFAFYYFEPRHHLQN